MDDLEATSNNPLAPPDQEEAVSGRARNGDVEVAYWAYGEGRPLFLITGLGMPAATWGPLPSVLGRKGYRAVVMDNRDSGESTVCEGMDYTIADMAADAAAVLDELQIEKTYVVGISMGGFIAQEVALESPGRVERLMLLATGPGIGGGLPPETYLMDEMLNAPEDQDPHESTVRLIAMLAGPGWAEQNKRLVQYAASKRVGMPTDMTSLVRHWVASATFSSWDRLDQIKCPVLLMHGAADALIPIGNGENLASRIPQAELIRLEGSGHLVPLERPRELMSAIGRFFPAGAGGSP